MTKRVRLLDEKCSCCGRQINSWDKKVSKALAYEYPCCERCIAAEYDMETEALRARMEHYFGIRPCLGI